MVEYLSLILLLIILMLPKIKFSLNERNSLSLQNSTYLRGLLCILVFLNHFSGWFENQGIIFYVFSHLGSFVVGAFFFLSGFGLMKAYSGELKNTFLIKRFIKIFIPYWICELLYSVISACFNIPLQVDVNFKNIALASIRMSELVENSWYVAASAILYIAFFVCKKVLPKIDMSIKITVLLIAFSLIFSSSSYWTTFFAFPLGVFFCEHENEINGMNYKKSASAIFLLVLVCASAILLKYYGYSVNNLTYMDISDFVTSVAFAAIVYFFITFFYIGNSVLLFLGKISYEIYLMHGLGIRIAHKIVGLNSGIAFFILSLLFTLIMSYSVNFLSSLVLKKIKR